jgi:tRNA(Arg) A34 adenosine deaminase TadA
MQAKFAERVGLHEKIFLHAEIAALVKCREECDTIVVARVNPQGNIRMAKPCPICDLALKEAGVNHVYYTTDHGFLYAYKKDKK